MNLLMRRYRSENDYWRMRNFLRQVLMANDRKEHSWHVARLDHWRWHFIQNCRFCSAIEDVTYLWEDEAGALVGVLNSLGSGEIRLHIHPRIRSAEIEEEMVTIAEKNLLTRKDNRNILIISVDIDDIMRQNVLLDKDFKLQKGISHKWWQDLDKALPPIMIPEGYTLRSMGDETENAARSWASWRAFHDNEPDENYDKDFSWYANIQSTPLYRRDLDVIAVSEQGDIASFCTISYDDFTRSAVCVLVGTAKEHQRRGLGKAVMLEGFHRLQKLGCTRVFATAFDPPANALYGRVMEKNEIAETWSNVY